MNASRARRAQRRDPKRAGGLVPGGAVITASAKAACRSRCTPALSENAFVDGKNRSAGAEKAGAEAARKIEET
jgi:hypothetical protein